MRLSVTIMPSFSPSPSLITRRRLLQHEDILLESSGLLQSDVLHADSMVATERKEKHPYWQQYLI